MPDHLARSGQVRERRKQRGDQAQAHRKPGHFSTGQEKILSLGLLPAQVPAQPENAGHVNQDDPVVQPIQSAAGVGEKFVDMHPVRFLLP